MQCEVFQTTEEVLDFDEYEVGCVVFDDMLSSSHKTIHQFFTRERHGDLSVYFLSQSHFDSAKRTKVFNLESIFFFPRTSKVWKKNIAVMMEFWWVMMM